jgi:hypothetical protein
MNRIDVLLKTPFSSFNIEEKLEIRKLGAPTYLRNSMGSCLHLRKIEEGSFFTNKVTFNKFIIPYSFHELP